MTFLRAFVVFLLAAAWARAEAPYGGRVGFSTNAPPLVREAASDLAAHLSRISGRAFAAKEGLDGPGVLLAVAGQGGVPVADAEMLKGRKPEAVVLDGSDPSRAWIVGNTDLGVSDGAYSWLDELGCRWFFPSETWTVLPSGVEVALRGRRLLEPVFAYRGFSGTGGFGGKLWMDPGMTLQKRWTEWRRRNRYGRGAPGMGHTGESFSLRHKDELVAHPEWRAMVNGERLPFAEGVKLCVSNPAARDLLVRDRLATLKRQVAVAPDDPAARWVSVEPSDGGNHCECPECLKLGSVSDRVFSTANFVAKAFAREMPGAGVGLYAYHRHLAPISIDLEPNVRVHVIAYSFNRTGLTAEQLLRAWAKKAPAFAAGDKWSIPDWSWDLPSFNFLDLVPSRLRLWAEVGADGFGVETSHSAGAVGVALWMAARLSWEPKGEGPALLDDFCSRSFGRAAPPMRRMLERWAKGFALGEHELALSFRDLGEALRLADSPGASARLRDYARYLHYQRLYHEYLVAEGDPAARGPAVRALLEWCWRIRDSAMVHAYRLHRLLLNRREKGDPVLAREWDLHDPSAPGWAGVKPVADAELDRLVRDGVEKYRPLDVAEGRFSANLVPLHPPAKGADDAPGPVHAFSGTHRFEFVAPEGARALKLSFAGGLARAGVEHRITVTTRAGDEVADLPVPSDGAAHDVELPLPGGGHYAMEVFVQGALWKMQVPARWPFAAVGRVVPRVQSPGLCVYVPKGLSRFAVHYEGRPPMKIVGPDGAERAPDAPGRTVSVAVPKGMDGAVWQLKGMVTTAPLRVIGPPPVFGLTPEGMMIPSELAPPR
jgi:hypothetical protein